MTNGIVNVYKEKGFTSFDVVAKMRGIFHQKKVGHTGTLDPDAEGVLPVCLGSATKVCDVLTDKDKEYEAVLLLGLETDTQDVTGTVLSEREVSVTEEEVRSVVSSFVGDIMQVPPMFSALKVNGQKLCDLARKGVEVERKARPVTVHEIEILDMQLPRVHMRVHCGKGTYIRTLCRDIGERLGCGGCMEQLVRTRVSDFAL
ncbi:MAG: tRNA pseudouridine(55) synthase TruB, partial [Agathobacter sp.]|nr:tRNA pseudouridine(55) synthase TruB [Agathobacter sp.]